MLIISLAGGFLFQRNAVQAQQSYNVADLNTDGIVDLKDYTILVSNFLQKSDADEREFSATLLPNVEDSSGSGIGTIVLKADNTATVSLSFTGLSSPHLYSHIHGADDSVLFALPSGANITHQITLTSQQVQDLESGKYYFNVHSQNYPSGEIRGSIQ